MLKRIICFILVATVALSVSVSASALVTTKKDPDFDDRMYVQRFIDTFGGVGAEHGKPYTEEAHYYSEEDQEEPDLVLVGVISDGSSKPGYPMEVTAYCVDRFCYNIPCEPFATGHCVYDVKADEWLELPEAFERSYEGTAQMCNIAKVGHIYGDMDVDYDITILDATSIQRYLAGIIRCFYLTADYDRDGEATILDATAIQRKLAGIE